LGHQPTGRGAGSDRSVRCWFGERGTRVRGAEGRVPRQRLRLHRRRRSATTLVLSGRSSPAWSVRMSSIPPPVCASEAVGRSRGGRAL